MKERFLWGGILLAVLSWIGNTLYYQSHQLDQPIFLDHYYETFINEERNLTFYYLTNKQNPAEVVNVMIDGAEGVSVYQNNGFTFMSQNSTPQYEQEYRHHYLMSVTVSFRKDLLPLNDSVNEWSFERMEVFFNNQSSIVADIGKVNFFTEETNPNVFETRMGGSNNQHRSEEALVAKENLTVENISVPFSELAREIAIKVNLDQEKLTQLEVLKDGGDFPQWMEESREAEWDNLPGVSVNEELFPFSLKASEWMGLYMYFNPDRHSFYEFSIYIEGQTEKGETFVRNAPIIDHPHLDQQDVTLIISEKGGEKW